MKLKAMKAVLPAIIFSLVLLSSCNQSVARPVLSPQGGNNTQIMPDDMAFVGVGVGDSFSDARQMAFAEVVKKGVIYIIGENGYNAKKKDIDNDFLSYRKARHYVLGEVKATSPDKKKKWLSTGKNDSGQLELKLKAYIDLKKLKADLDALGVKPAPKPVQQVNNPVVSDNQASPSKNNPANEDLSGVDLSSLTFLVTYDFKDPVYKKDQMQAEYAKWAIGYINKELANNNITTFDADTMEKLANERNLIQEEASGSVGVGQLLANAVHAEIYAELTPSVSYTGKKANAIINVKIFVRTTGKLLDTFQIGGGEMESPDLNASIKMSMRNAAKKIMKKLMPILKKYVKGGRMYFVRLNGVSSYRIVSKFARAVKNINGVKSIRLKSGNKADGVYDFYLSFNGNPSDLLDRLFDSLPDQPGFENFDLQEARGNELIFTLE